MTIDDRVKQGDFEGALAVLRAQNAGPQPDPGQVLTQFNLEARLQQFEAAEATMRRLIGLAPQVAEPMAALARAARAEAVATARLGDPKLAGKRAAVGMPPPHAFLYVKAAVLHAQRDHAGAAAALAEAKAQTPAAAGTLTWVNGRMARFADVTDSDELTGPNLPCYDGDAVLDLPYSQLRSLNFLDARTSFDVMWTPSEVVTADGKGLRVRVPAFYAGTARSPVPQVRTGQMTTWGREHGYALGAGQRDLKFTMEGGAVAMVGVLQIQRLEFDARPAAAADKPKGFWGRLFG